tara:strand:+ start:771 stop:1022 length:252 start_codon:yes stop_codon:yes gene_type:complete
MYSLFDYAFAPPTIVVVSEERLKAAELKAKERQLLQVKVQLENLQDFYSKLEGEVKALQPAVNDVNAKPGSDLDSMDGGTHDG